MATPWKEVIASPNYQSLSSEQKAAAQDQYFNEVVAPQVGSNVEQAKKQFYSAYPIGKPQLSDAQMANLDIPTDEILAYHNAQKPQQQPEMGNPVVEAGKGLLQTGANVVNIVPEISDAISSFGAWAGQAIGGDGTYQPAPRLQLPDDLKPQDKYAMLGAEIGPYLIPLIGPERTAAVLSQAANASKAERAAVRGADMVAENTVGALAQNSSKDNAASLATDLSLGVAGSGIARAAGPLLSRAYGSVSNKVNSALGRETQQAAQQTAQQTAERTAADAVNPEQVATEETLRKLAVQKNPDLANSLEGLNVNVRPEVRQSADRLGLTDDLLPSHLSGNQQYQAVEQAIKSRAGSALKVQEDAAILRLSEQAGRLIDDVANVPDALSLNQRVINQFDNRMNALERRSDQLYQRVDNAIPPQSRVVANNTAQALERKADELGGWENLDTIEKNVFKAVNPTDDGVLTYANLNKQRRLVGQALYKNRGPYKDADEGALKYLYRQLSEDQRVALGNAGVRRDFEVAQRLVQMRKNMEDQMVGLRGKNLTGDVANRGSQSVSSLAKGNSKQFIELMENLPTRQMRQEVAAASIRDMLSTGKRGADFNPAGFADWYQNLRTSGNLRVLARHMPREFMSGLHDTYVVADAIRRAKSFEITTGKLKEFTDRFDAVTAKHELAAKYARQIGTMAGTKFGPLGAVAGGALGEKIAARARKLGGAGSSEAADKLISSPEFQMAVRNNRPSVGSAKGKPSSNQFDEVTLRSSPAWREFYNTLPDSEKRLIARMGFIWWVNQDDSNPDSDR
ncbi:hypothetical protein [Providencia sp. PROV113]|uniref:hypothetical protein n=1 Tax=Providencia sp. PROV113 TaxID=2949824 RepID=UPI0023494D13|nr:hypothetical protein [Providencia sp. PROV113]